MGKSEKKWIFTETIATSDMKFGRCRHLIELMNVREY